MKRKNATNDSIFIATGLVFTERCLWLVFCLWSVLLAPTMSAVTDQDRHVVVGDNTNHGHPHSTYDL